ncbi:hypothetical protein BDK51DRAFT_26844, partial [Blyttiomyces helicus]
MLGAIARFVPLARCNGRWAIGTSSFDMPLADDCQVEARVYGMTRLREEWGGSVEKGEADKSQGEKSWGGTRSFFVAVNLFTSFSPTVKDRHGHIKCRGPTVSLDPSEGMAWRGNGKERLSENRRWNDQVSPSLYSLPGFFITQQAEKNTFLSPISTDVRLCSGTHLKAAKHRLSLHRRDFRGGSLIRRTAASQLREPFPPACSVPNDAVASKATRGPSSQSVTRPDVSSVSVSKVKTEAPAAHAFRTNDTALLRCTCPFRTTPRHSRRFDEEKRSYHEDLPKLGARRRTARQFFSNISEFGTLENLVSFEKGRTNVHDQASAPEAIVAQTPAAHAFWTENFGDELKVCTTTSHAALARSGRKHDHICLQGKVMTPKILRALVLRLGLLANTSRLRQGRNLPGP